MRAIVIVAALAGTGCAATPPSVAPSHVSMEATSRPVEVAGAPSPTATAAHRSLTLEGAKTAIAGAVAYARGKKTTGVIAIVDAGGNLMALERIDDTFAAGAMISIGKARTAVMFKKPTRVFEEIIKGGRTPMVAVHDFMPLTGGVPIEIGGEVVGGIGVSGAANATQDEELAIAGAQAVEHAIGEAPKPDPVAAAPALEPPGQVVFFPHDKVAAAFAKGMPLVEQPTANLKVHASRREGAGQVEVHTKDADVIYVVEGTATLVTGGSVIDPKPTEPEELRGTSIDGGTVQELAKGDVVIVPKATPHWFKKVSKPFLYYVVKVRS
jgi:uncharacterized protein GlcG (DUF336 family)/quercetin dioxygenase-like cupin family protein